MKKIVPLLLVLLLVFGCLGKSEKPEAYTIPAVVIPPGKYEMVFSEEMDMTTVTDGISVPVKNKQTEYLELTVEPKSPDGKQKLSLEWKRVTFKQDSQYMPVDYDSADPNKQKSSIPNLDALLGLKLELLRNETGKIVEISGFDDFSKAKTGQNPGMKSMYDSYQKMIDPEYLSRYFRDYGKLMRKTPVAVGEEWTMENKIAAPLLGEFDTEQKIRLDKIEDEAGVKIAVISSTAKIDAEKDREVEFGSFKMRYSRIGIEDSETIKLDLESGLLKSHTTVRKLRTESSMGNSQTTTSNDVTRSLELKPFEN